MREYDEFFSDEAMRYSAECRRMAGLSRNAPKMMPRKPRAAYRRILTWLPHILFSPLQFSHHMALAPRMVRAARR